MKGGLTQGPVAVLCWLLGAGSCSWNVVCDIAGARSGRVHLKWTVGIPEWLGLEGTLKIILFQAEQSSPRPWGSPVPKDGAPRASVHSLGRCLGTLSVKEQLP